MLSRSKLWLPGLLFLVVANLVSAQTGKVQQGIFYKTGTGTRVGGVQVLNKRSSATVQSNIYGTFSIPASIGDTLELTCTGYNNTTLVVADFTDKICYLNPAIALPEVVIKETSVQANLDEAKKGYRKKSVFYTGTPHYYYLLLKPMTFIYENFKSEVIDARKFNRFAKNETAYYEIDARFNDYIIKNTIPIQNKELEDFKSDYWPTVEQVHRWNNYDLISYITNSYQDFRKKHNTAMHK